MLVVYSLYAYIFFFCGDLLQTAGVDAGAAECDRRACAVGV